MLLGLLKFYSIHIFHTFYLFKNFIKSKYLIYLLIYSIHY